MIDIKGTKSDDGPQTPGEIYAAKSDERPKGAFALGFLLISLVIYLKAFFTGEAEAMSQPDSNSGSASDDAAIPPHANVMHAPAQPDRDAQPPDGQPADSQTAGADLGFTPQPDTISFFTNQPEPGFPVPRTAGFIPFAANSAATPTGYQVSGGPSLRLVPPLSQDSRPVAPNPVPSDDSDDAQTTDEDDGTQEDPRNANRAPVVTSPVTLKDVTSCGILTIALADLLRHASDPDGDILSVRDLSVSSGELVAVGDGWQFSPGGTTGPVTISYMVTDGIDAIEQTAHLAAATRQITGTGADDLLIGTSCADDIVARSGHDKVDGRDGDDVIDGGDGNDHLIGGGGADVIRGGNGNDIVFGGAGDDHLSGGGGHDRLFGGAGDDVLSGDAGDDEMFGGDGNDLMTGGDGADWMEGGSGDDVLVGGAGDDLLAGGSGSDVVLAGAGNDRVIGTADRADDVYDGETGDDSLNYSHLSQSITVNLAAGTARGGEIGNDTIRYFEEIKTGDGDDHILLGGADVSVSGGGGNDLFELARSDAEIAPNKAVVMSRFEILDFEVGDRLKIGAREFYERAPDEVEDLFERIYSDSDDDEHGLLRVRNEWDDDENERSVVEADFDEDGVFEVAVWLTGHHDLGMCETG